jgi:hypothetical protein
MEQQIPTFSSNSFEDDANCVTVSREEFIGDIVSSQAFLVQAALTINPGVEEVFPWLSKLAVCFCMYQFESLIFTYKSTSGALSTTQALGQIIGSANYNAYEAAPTSKQMMLNEVFSDSKVPSEDCYFPIECDPKQTSQNGLLFIRGGSATSGDQRMYDLGNFYLASNGQTTDGTKLGELWVSYKIRLYKPQLPASGISATNLSIIANSAYTNAAPLGSGTQTVTQNDLGLTVSGTVITFPALIQGTFLLNTCWSGTGGVSFLAPTVTLSSGITQSLIRTGPAATATNVKAAVQVLVLVVSPSTTPQTVTYSGTGTLPTSSTSMTILCCHS